MHSATCSIWSREMKLKVSGETGTIQAAPSMSTNTCFNRMVCCPLWTTALLKTARDAG